MEQGKQGQGIQKRQIAPGKQTVQEGKTVQEMTRLREEEKGQQGENGQIERQGQNIQKEQREERQRRKLKEFDRELFSYTGHIAWFLSGIFSLAVLGLMCIPVQEIEREDSFVRVAAFISAIWIPYSVLLPYVNITDTFERRKNNRNRTYDKLKYLPVSRKQYILARMGYLFRYMWKLALAGTAVQCIVAAVDMGRVEPVNVAYAVGILLIMPLAAGWVLLKVGM